MFGKNEIERELRADGAVLDVHSIFPTVQGEGPYAGLAATFVRLAGCHLRCHFCDTDFTTGRQLLQLGQIIEALAPYRLVVLTGGEPMRQNIVPLCRTLIDQKRHVQIETAGHFWPGVEDELRGMCLADEVSIVVSPKTAVVHPQVKRFAFAWKYIITADAELSETDGLPVRSTQRSECLQVLARPAPLVPPDQIYVQPCDHYAPAANAMAIQRCVELCECYGYRLSLQQHKIIGVP